MWDQAARPQHASEGLRRAAAGPERSCLHRQLPEDAHRRPRRAQVCDCASVRACVCVQGEGGWLSESERGWVGSRTFSPTFGSTIEPTAFLWCWGQPPAPCCLPVSLPPSPDTPRHPPYATRAQLLCRKNKGGGGGKPPLRPLHASWRCGQTVFVASNGSAAAAAMMSQQWAAIKMDGLRDDGLQRRLAADSLSRSLACCRRDLLTHCVVREPYPDEGQRPRRVAAPASLKTHFSGTTLEMACEVRHEFLELPAFLRFPSFQGQPGVHWLHQHTAL